MSVSPKNLISRFHDLKIWQKHHDSVFKKTRRNSRDSELSHLEVMDGVGILESSVESTPDRSPPQNREEIVLPSPPKTFEELLLEKLGQEDPPMEVPPKPKRPYLKKGSGLKRYGLEPGIGVKFVSKNPSVRKKCEVTRKPSSRPRSDVKSASSSLTDCKLKPNVKKQRPKSLHLGSADTRSAQWSKPTKEGFPKSASTTSSDRCKPKVILQKEQDCCPPAIPSILRSSKLNTKRNLTELKNSIDLTPLKMPSLNVQVNARWCKADEVEQKKNVHFADAGDFYFNTPCEDKVPPIQESPEKNHKTDEGLMFKDTKTNKTVQNMVDNTGTPEVNLRSEQSEQSLYEKQLEKELLLFEMLEQKAENSSFCSTSSSILQLLTNSPSKFRLGCSPSRLLTPLKSIAENVSINEHRPLIPDDPNLSTDSLLMQIKVLLDKKMSREILSGFDPDSYKPRSGVSIKDIESGQTKPSTCVRRMSYMSPDSVTEETPKDFPNNTETTSSVQKEADKFSDEEEWSTNTEISDTSLNTSSEIETSQSEMEHKEVKDAATNTVVVQEQVKEVAQKSVSCSCSEEINKKLTELNKEIAAFRADHSQLQEERRQLNEEKALFEQQMKKLRKEFEDERIEMLYEVEESKKKLAKDKLVFEKHTKEIRSQPNRKEREEISNLKIELTNLKETIKLKDTKNGTTQARLRTQLKQLEKENANLKEEVEKLTRENAKHLAQQKLNLRPSDTKIIHEINKNLSKIAKEAFKSRPPYNTQGEVDSDDGVDTSQEKNKISWHAKKKHDPKVEKGKKVQACQHLIREDKLSVESTGKRRSNGGSDSVKDDLDNFDDNSFKNLTNIDIERHYDQVFGNATTAEQKHDSSLGDVKKIGCVESLLEDGSKDIKYDNGDMKTISPDGNYVRKRYINGDVRETILSEGLTKYTFGHDGSCHTTYADGTEIFEFPSGQVEKKHRDGKYEIQFPNGVIRAVFPEGYEEIIYPDGTYVQVNQDGTKNLYLPNGQREFHNEHFKRREYPNGTIKIVYNDGRQETQYCDGRIRIRDGDGNLILDSHAN